jgi:hypothetical protein
VVHPHPEGVVEEVAELAVLPPGLVVGEEPLVEVCPGVEEGEEDLDPGLVDEDMPEGPPLGPCPRLHPLNRGLSG